MDEKRRSKRSKPLEEGMWDCSVCTYKNPSEAFKCEMCDVRKGTSTRKPRINPQLVAQQVVAQHVPVGPPPPKKERRERDKDGKDADSLSPTAKISPVSFNSQKEKRKSNRPPRLKNIDWTSGRSMSVTVDDVTVIITDYKTKKPKLSVSQESVTASNPSVSTPPTTPEPTQPNCISSAPHSQLLCPLLENSTTSQSTPPAVMTGDGPVKNVSVESEMKTET